MRATVWLLILLASCTGGFTGPDEGSPTPVSRPGDPYPYTTPTPAREASEVDGAYTRTIGRDLAGGRGPCRRCPPYRMEEGEQSLTLSEGVFRIDNAVIEQKAIDWKSVGHFTVEGDRITFFNDPNCPQSRGVYAFALDEGQLRLQVVDDPCAFSGLRARYLTAAPWRVS